MSSAIFAARCHYQNACKALRIAREQAAERPTPARLSTVAIFEARADLAAMHCCRIESESVAV